MSLLKTIKLNAQFLLSHLKFRKHRREESAGVIPVFIDPKIVDIARMSPEEAYEAEKEVQMGKFKVFKDKKGEWRFNLVGRNGKVVCSGESYKRKASALNGIEAIKRIAKSSKIEVAE